MFEDEVFRSGTAVVDGFDESPSLSDEFVYFVFRVLGFLFCLVPRWSEEFVFPVRLSRIGSTHESITIETLTTDTATVQSVVPTESGGSQD